MNPQIFGLAVSKRSKAMTAMRRINTYYDFPKQGQEDRGAPTIFGRPGLRRVAYYGASPCRGWRVVEPYLYAVFGNTLWRIANDYTRIALGTLLSTAGGVSAADNGNQVVFADNPNLYCYQIFGVSAATGLVAGSMQTFVPNALGFLGARYVSYLNNDFLVAVPGTNPLAAQTWQVSNDGDGTGWNALAFDLADEQSDPLLAVVGYQGVVRCFGTQSTENWVNLGRAIFKFGRMPGSSWGYGLAAVRSVVEMGDAGLALLAQSRDGDPMPALLGPQGFQPIGTPDLIATIKGYGQFADAIGASYQFNGHRFFQLTFPSAPGFGGVSGATWQWDSASDLWTEAQAYAPGGSLGNPGVMFNGALACQFNGRTVLADPNNGALYELDGARYTDDTATETSRPLVRQLTSSHIFAGDQVQILREIQFDMQEGCGLVSGQGSNPLITLEISRDKGNTYSPPLQAALGAMGQYATRILFRRGGRFRDGVMRLTYSDPTPFVLTGEAMLLEGSALRRAG
jgi:hypothetical protein